MKEEEKPLRKRKNSQRKLKERKKSWQKSPKVGQQRERKTGGVTEKEMKVGQKKIVLLKKKIEK